MFSSPYLDPDIVARSLRVCIRFRLLGIVPWRNALLRKLSVHKRVGGSAADDAPRTGQTESMGAHVPQQLVQHDSSSGVAIYRYVFCLIRTPKPRQVPRFKLLLGRSVQHLVNARTQETRARVIEARLERVQHGELGVWTREALLNVQDGSSITNLVDCSFNRLGQKRVPGRGRDESIPQAVSFVNVSTGLPQK